ncbi:7107_t:CDS:2 [Paraglomus occultum]|uniref:7107_t:CDS:1 n=1 Tax=Paraglomus occultum TaxID=144539 RepID=A0A9N8ZCF9_9GLOM|nr:7107_t:CDS:2 [Paraglomus occultum]
MSFDITLNSEEKIVYGILFRKADEEKKGFITGSNAVKLFSKSWLPQNVLGEIWQIVDSSNKGVLTKETFSAALRLIAQAQNGGKPDVSLVSKEAPLPRFDGVYIVSEARRKKYKNVFDQCDAKDGLLGGDKAKLLFTKSKLPIDKLAQIWNLVDTKNRGELDVTEFIIAMYFIEETMNGTLTTLPQTLSPELYESASGGTPYEPNNILSTSSPLLVRQQTARASSSDIFDTLVDDAWDVSPEDRTKYFALFEQLDKEGRGYITGEQAATFFLNSKLPQDDLAQIWDLADIGHQGKLDRYTFAVAMYLILKRRTGNALPLTLPQTLIPPSMRRAKPNSGPTPAQIGIPPLYIPPAADNQRSSDFDLLMSSPTSPRYSVGGISARPPENDIISSHDLPAQVNIAAGEVGKLQQQISLMEGNTIDMKKKQETFESTLSSLQKQKQELSVRLTQVRTLHDAELKSLQEVENNYRKELVALEQVRSELNQAERVFATLQAERDGLANGIAKNRDEIQELRKRIRITEENTNNIKLEIEKLKKEEGQQKGVLAINKKQLSTLETKRIEALKTQSSLQDGVTQSSVVSTPVSEIQSPFPSSSVSKPDFDEFVDAPSNRSSLTHSQKGSSSSFPEIEPRRAMSVGESVNLEEDAFRIKGIVDDNNTNSTLKQEGALEKPASIATSKPSEFESVFGDPFAPKDKESSVTATNAFETSVFTASPFETGNSDPMTQLQKNTDNIQSVSKTEDKIKEPTDQPTSQLKSQEVPADPFAQFTLTPSLNKSNINAAFGPAFFEGDKDNDQGTLTPDAFATEFPSLQDFESGNFGFEDNFTIEGNAVKEGEKDVKEENKKEDKKEEGVVWESNSEVIGDNKETANNMTKEESLSDQGTTSATSDGVKQEIASGDVKQESTVTIPDSIFSDSEIPSVTNIADNIINTSTPSSEPFAFSLPPITPETSTIDAKPMASTASESVLPSATTKTPSAISSQAVSNVDFDSVFEDLSAAPVGPPVPIDFDATFDESEFDREVSFTFDEGDVKNSSSEGKGVPPSATSAASNKTSPLAFDPFDPSHIASLPGGPSLTNTFDTKTSRSNLDEAFGGTSPFAVKKDDITFGFDDAFAELTNSAANGTNGADKNSAIVKESEADKQTKTGNPPSKSNEDEDTADVKKLRDMGFSREAAVKALEKFNYNFDMAVDFLVGN